MRGETLVCFAGATAAASAVVAAGGGGRSPPFRGRTMKEYEEMLAQLRKENFNLKLRLYFLEERGIVGAPGEGCGGSEAVAALRLELEQLRRDAADKQQLLCEAARAVELLEEQHREQLMAARTAAQQALSDAQAARAHAQQLAADAQRAREEAESEITTMRKAAADAAAEAAVETERLRLELQQARDAAREAVEAERAARAEAVSMAAAAAVARRQTPCSPSGSPPPSPRSPLSRSPGECSGSLRAAVHRAQTQLSALEGELAAVRAELRRQTEARAAAERGLAEGRAVHAKSLQTVQALARLCKERGREAEGLRARLGAQQRPGDENKGSETEERGSASGDEGAATPRPSPAGSPSLPALPASPMAFVKGSSLPDIDGAAQESALEGEGGSAPSTVLLHANVTLRRDIEALQARSREQDEELAAREAKLLAAEERAKRLEEELTLMRRDGSDCTTPVPAITEQGEQKVEDEKDQLIERLRSELRQRTANLQELVNKELWDKNRQIERLQARLARLGSPAATRAPAAGVAPDTILQAASIGSPPLGKTARESPSRSPSRPLGADTSVVAPPPPSSPSSSPRRSGDGGGDGDGVCVECADGEATEGEEEETALRRRLEESVRERACLAAQLDDLRRRVHDASAAVSAFAVSSQSSEDGRVSVSATTAAVEETAVVRAALARSEAGRRETLAACGALARRLDALARALPPLLRRHQRGVRSCERRASASGSGTGGGGGGRRLRALERALSAAARAARALASVEGAVEFALPEVEVSVASSAESTCMEIPVRNPGQEGGAGEGEGEGEEAPASLTTRASESEVDAWSEPDRTVSLARVGLSPLSDRRAAAAAAAVASSVSSDEEQGDEATSHASLAAGDRWASDDTIASSAEKLIGNENSEMQILRARVAELETRVCEKDNELLEQQCALLEMRNTYTARCLQAEGQLSDLLMQVQQVQADAEAERHSARDQVFGVNEVSSPETEENGTEFPHRPQVFASAADKSSDFLKAEIALVAHAEATAEAMEAERLSAEFALGLQQQVQVMEARQRESEAERRWRAADAALLRQRDAAAVAESRAALERTQLQGERVRLERALRREEAAAAAAARAHRHERRHLQEQVLSLQASNRMLNRQLTGVSTLQLSPAHSPSDEQLGTSPHSFRGSTEADHDRGLCQLSAFHSRNREAELESLGLGLEGESMGSTSPPLLLQVKQANSWLLAARPGASAPLSVQPPSTFLHAQRLAPRSLPAFSRQHSAFSAGYESAGDCGGPASPQTCCGTYSWVSTRLSEEQSHGAGSPDLGIESDAGRFSSLEPPSSHCGSCNQETVQGLCGFQGTDVESELTRLQKENNNLKRNLSRTKHLLETTVTQLSSSNQLKRQMEITICKQLNKTHSVLKQAKADCDVTVELV